jgi:hypothetical protein
MRVDFREAGTHQPNGLLIRRDTGEMLRDVFFFDDSTGEFGYWLRDEDGNTYTGPDGRQAAKFARAPLLFIKEKRDGD